MLQTHCLRCKEPNYLQHEDEQDLCIKFPTFWLEHQKEEGDGIFSL